MSFRFHRRFLFCYTRANRISKVCIALPSYQILDTQTIFFINQLFDQLDSVTFLTSLTSYLIMCLSYHFSFRERKYIFLCDTIFKTKTTQESIRNISQCEKYFYIVTYSYIERVYQTLVLENIQRLNFFYKYR